ncbi:predicted protein [Nematostella vectensis]|uniref:BTB domain-containing protein n=1 Tax=Nematostella vectensis TaxID=45351 RepID=A7S2N5_NEMVE|nr:predicted protein [Nematostella vectensis]|eukprot:XP_001634098.1 predicted protein [Nematostella vectensis]
MAGKDATFCVNAMQSMDDFRKERFLCDVTLNVNEVLFHAHRNILAASSPYFRALFTSEMRENQGNEIKLNNVDVEIMEDILAYLYSGSVVVEESKAIPLTVAADYMLLPKLKQLGIDFLSHNLTSANCLSILAIAEKFNFQTLKDNAQRYTLEQFGTVSQAEEFERLNVEQLLAIISCDDLVAKEQEVFEAVVRWVDFSLEERRKHFEILFRHLRLVYLPRCYLEDVVKGEELVRESDACKLLVVRAEEYFSLSYDERKRRNLFPQPRTCQNGIFIAGGWLETNRITNEAHLFVPNLSECYDLAPMITARKNHGMTLHDGGIFVVGGASMEETALRSAELYDPRSNSWSTVMSMRKEVAALGVASFGNYIYAIGGHDNTGRPLNVVQRYDSKDNSWSFVASLNESRTRLCVVATEDQIYAFGGFSSEEYMPLKSCETYKVDNDAWYEIPPMRHRRSGASATYLHQQIYIIGGEDLLEVPFVLDACEVYTPVSNSWSVIAPLCVPRSHGCSGAIKDKVYALCGINKGRELHSIECYDTYKRQWEVVDRLKVAIEGLACCITTVPGELLASIM